MPGYTRLGTTGGAQSCPAGTLPLYRAYYNAYPLTRPKNPWDSNHRFTSARADITTLVAGGWRPEGVGFCTAQQDGSSAATPICQFEAHRSNGA